MTTRSVAKSGRRNRRFVPGERVGAIEVVAVDVVDSTGDERYVVRYDCCGKTASMKQGTIAARIKAPKPCMACAVKGARAVQAAAVERQQREAEQWARALGAREIERLNALIDHWERAVFGGAS